ncbi:MAG TPA: hypothetical protein VJV04_16530 [Nitrospiraceae bacterium]|nr:hypothetical protein [Nitrospiraceae bacterium]
MGMRSLALSCILLYAIVGFLAGACPSLPVHPSPSQPPHHQHHPQPGKPASHTLTCVWACHASANSGAIDVPSQLVLVWFVATLLVFPEVWMCLTRLLLIFARPPPLFFA